MAKTEQVKTNPMKITDPDTGDVYVLDFNRESVKFAEQRGFDILTYKNHLQTGISDLFFYAFRKNHKNVGRNKTDAILEELGGLLNEEVARLEELYVNSITSLNLENERKNSRMTVEL